MSWCRWGSKCWETIVVYGCDSACGDACPGSDLYIFESNEGIECCACSLRPDDGDVLGYANYVARSEDEMLDHIEEHVAAGHHVRPSLRRGADPALAESAVAR